MTEAMHQVLVIEDEPNIRHVLKVLLEAERYRVIEADTALRAEIEARSHDSRSLRVCIKNLRGKLEPDPRKPRYLVTEAGLGYRLRAEND